MFKVDVSFFSLLNNAFRRVMPHFPKLLPLSWPSPPLLLHPSYLHSFAGIASISDGASSHFIS